MSSTSECSVCIKTDVCKYKEDYENILKDVESLTKKGTEEQNIFTVQIHCNYYRANVSSPTFRG